MKKIISLTSRFTTVKLNQLVFAGQILVLAAAFPLIGYLELSRTSNTADNSTSGTNVRVEASKQKAVALNNESILFSNHKSI